MDAIGDNRAFLNAVPLTFIVFETYSVNPVRNGNVFHPGESYILLARATTARLSIQRRSPCVNADTNLEEPVLRGPAEVNVTPSLKRTDSARIDQAFVFGQLGQTLDGRIATMNGVSKYINGSDALDHLHALRADVDAVLVGVGTVIADDPMLTVRRCTGKTPRAVVIDPRRRTPDGAQIFNAGDCKPLFIRQFDDVRDENDVGVRLLPAGKNDARPLLDPVDMVARLCERGYPRILIEGGASTLSHFINHRAIDRLHILQAPMILGSGVTGLNLAPIYSLEEALRPKVRVSQFSDGDVLYECSLKSAWSQ